MTHRRAVIVCEDDFLDVHVGVRRVTGTHIQRLQEAGYGVELAAMADGVLRLASPARRDRMLAALRDPRRGSDAPFDWRKEPEAPGAQRRRSDAVWDGRRCDPDDFEVSLLTAPWIAGAPEFPDVRLTHCVVHDLVPNLISAQALDVGEFVDAVAFAHAHHVGYVYTMTKVGTALCVSASTSRDLEEFYGGIGTARIVVDTPFLPGTGSTDELPEGQDERSPVLRILLVNALDPRKNIGSIADALVQLSARHRIEVTVVGRERMPWPWVVDALDEIDAAVDEVTWYRDCSDVLLDQLYRRSDVLLFPSVYEGLGLPVLEAQAVGVPVVTTTTSSCGEINLNPSLQCPTTSAEDIAAVVEAFTQRRCDVLTGRGLAAAQDRFLRARRSDVGW